MKRRIQDRCIIEKSYTHLYWGKVVCRKFGSDYAYTLDKPFLDHDCTIRIYGEEESIDISYVDCFEHLLGYEENIRKMLQTVFDSHGGYELTDFDDDMTMELSCYNGHKMADIYILSGNIYVDIQVYIEIKDKQIRICFGEWNYCEFWYGCIDNPESIEKREEFFNSNYVPSWIV